jgi:hypothetical protein
VKSRFLRVQSNYQLSLTLILTLLIQGCKSYPASNFNEFINHRFENNNKIVTVVGFMEVINHHDYNTFDIYESNSSTDLIDVQFYENDHWINKVRQGKRVCVLLRGKYVDYEYSGIIPVGNLSSRFGKIEAESVLKCKK